MDQVGMDQEGLLIELDKGRVTRVMTNGAPLPGGAAVTYDGQETRMLPVHQPSNAEQIERIAAALREGRANTQRQGIRKACEKAAGHYQAIAQATGALASLLADLRQTHDSDPVALVTRMQEAVNRIDADVLREVRQQLLVRCAAAMDLDVGAVEDEHERPPAIPPVVPKADVFAATEMAPPETETEESEMPLPRIATRAIP